MVIHAVRSRASLRRQGANARIMVVLPPRHHPSVAVVRPDANDVIGQADQSLPVQLHDLAVKVGAAGRSGQRFLNHVVLPANQPGDQRSALFRRVVLRIILPEGAVALAPEAEIPDHLHVLLRENRIAPKLLKQRRVLRVRSIQPGICAAEHLRAQRLGMVMRHIQAIRGRQLPIAMGVFVRSRDHEIAAQTKERFKRHFPRLVPAAVQRPGAQQHLVVDKPSPVAHSGRLSGAFSAGNLNGFAPLQLLIVPEPEGCNAQRRLRQMQQPIDRAQIIRIGNRNAFRKNRHPPALRRQPLAARQRDFVFPSVPAEHRAHVPPEHLRRPSGRSRV